MSRGVFIIAGESSGEIYGARLAGTLREKWPGVSISGMGGVRMKEAGVRLVAGITSAIGLFEVLRSFGELRRMLNTALAAIEEQRPDVLVLIDYPDFNFRVGKRARALGIKVLYYVTPQVWAWRKGRVRDMAAFVDRAAVILPFEEEHLRRAGIEAEFVGHPISEEMEGRVPEKADAKGLLGLEPDRPYVALLPGSRDTELSRLLPVLYGVVERFQKERPEYGYVLSIAPNIDPLRYRAQTDAFRQRGVVITREDITAVYAASEAAVVASGTAAFQAVFTGTPLTVIYKVSAMTYLIMRRLVSLRFVNLVNLILGREAVKEIIQGEATPENITAELRGLLLDRGKAVRLKEDLASVRSMFLGMNPSERVAGIIGEMAGWSQ